TTELVGSAPKGKCARTRPPLKADRLGGGRARDRRSSRKSPRSVDERAGAGLATVSNNKGRPGQRQADFVAPGGIEAAPAPVRLPQSNLFHQSLAGADCVRNGTGPHFRAPQVRTCIHIPRSASFSWPDRSSPGIPAPRPVSRTGSALGGQ